MPSTNRRTLLASAPALVLAGCALPQNRQTEAFDVAVVGAGLAGLECALQLEAAGARVVVLEAESRVGGRVYTGRELADRPEFGGIQVGDTYGVFHARARALGVEIGRYPHAFPRANYFVGGRVETAQTWPTSAANKLSNELRQLTPDRLLAHATRPLNPLREINEWSDPQFSNADTALSTILKQANFDDEAIRLAGVNANNNGLDQASAIATWRGQTLQSKGRSAGVVVDGSDAMTTAMAGALTQRVRTGQQVRSIERSGSGLRLRGADFNIDAAHVVVAIPPSAAQRVAFDDCVSERVKAAWQALPFTAISLVFVDTEPFWEKDGHSAYMWTDGPFERWFPRIDAASGETVGFKVWLNGVGALRADQLDSAAIEPLVQDELRRLRPASAGNARVARVMSWQRYGDYAGAYPEWPIGQAALLAEALQTQSDRVTLAGDYTSMMMTGLEGAIGSGAHAAARVLRILS